MSNESDARVLQALALECADRRDEQGANVLQRVAAQLGSDAKRDAQYDALQDTGKCAFYSIAEMVAALECDYDRLEELREMRAEFNEEYSASKFAADYSAEAEELAELEKAAGECESRDDAMERIQEDPLSVEMRGDWYGSGTEPADATTPVEFCILLGFGGPATRIIGELSYGEPTRARLQAQDWGTQWTDYRGGDSDTLLTYCRCFYFGEG